MEHELMNIKNNAVSLILETKSREEVEETRVQFLGRNGTLTQAMKEIATLPKEERPEVGKLANEIKEIIEQMLTDRASSLASEKTSSKASTLDVTEPGVKPPLGHLHLITQAIEEITGIFSHLGFTKVRYPEIEWDYYGFTALNFPDDHPARDDWETFFIRQEPDIKKGGVILTPHTSSGQVREMERHVAMNPKDINIKMLNIAKCYRRQSDVSHTQMFHQFEGLVVGEGISITHLKGTLDYFVKSYFGPNRVSRIRPYHFQFTEPSFEVDVSCGVCNGKGCRLCKEGWLEMGGSGMVHPNVLKYGGIDPKKYTGFAFGWGVERVLMMKEGIEIDDLRLLYSNNLEFLEQF
ncbi:MAG: phenylalanyl-tRNA synthetase subunit alpha, phenylalanyl-tRNA synthetase alpha chain [Candidatus Parcubacteria bacterium]|jgi:phenylalanyl-tRNA synthetase alpha chain